MAKNNRLTTENPHTFEMNLLREMGRKKSFTFGLSVWLLQNHQDLQVPEAIWASPPGQIFLRQ